MYLADLSITESVLTPAAAALANKPDLFKQRYGDMFARACRQGGLFVGVMRIETFDDSEASSIEGELGGSYGLFSADVTANFKAVTAKHTAGSTAPCTVRVPARHGS